MTFQPRNRKLLYVFILFFFASINLFTQPLNSWNIVNVRLKFDKNWSGFIEGQLRSQRFYNDFNYYEVKGGINYNINDYFTATAGIGNYDTYTSGGNFVAPITQDELRTWLQFVIKAKLDRLRFEHRYRAEQRFIQTGYKNRFRYRFNMLVPLNAKTIKPGTVYAITSNEIFLTNKAPYFERNRLYAGVGYEINEQYAVQVGWLNQFDYKIESANTRNFLQILFSIDLDLRKTGLEREPSVSE